MTRAANFAGLACLPFVVVHLADGFWKASLAKAAPPVFWTVDVTEWIVLPALSFWLLHRFAPISRRDYGLAWPGGWRFARALLLCTLTLALLHDFGTSVLGPRLFQQTADSFSFGKLLPPSGLSGDLGAFYLAGTAAVCESLFYLGLPWMWFSQDERVSFTGKAAFALTTSFIFALAHFETGWPNCTGAFLFQIGAVAWYLRLRTLWPIIGAHFLIDLYLFTPK